MTFLNEQKEHENFHLEEKGGKKQPYGVSWGFLNTWRCTLSQSRGLPSFSLTVYSRRASLDTGTSHSKLYNYMSERPLCSPKRPDTAGLSLAHYSYFFSVKYDITHMSKVRPVGQM